MAGAAFLALAGLVLTPQLQRLAGMVSMPVECSPNVPIEKSSVRYGSIASVSAWRFDVGEFG